MTFKKPRDITLVQMAQWIDSLTSYQDNIDRLVEYLYHLSYYNAQKRALFNNYESYDDFAIFCASKLLTRLNNKNKEHVKSIVNYINNVLSPWYSEYVSLFCSGASENIIEDFDVSDFADYLVDTTCELDRMCYRFGYSNISSIIENHLKYIPRKKHNPEWGNIYTSCLLTLQDRINCAEMLCNDAELVNNPALLHRHIRSLKKRSPILFHLDESLSNYILVLVNELTHAICTELSYAAHSTISPDTCLTNLMIAANNDEEED